MIVIDVQGNAEGRLTSIQSSASNADANIRRLQHSVDGLSNNFNSLSRSTQQSTTNMRGFIASAIGLDTVRRATVSIVSEFSELQQKLLDIQKTTGLSKQGTKDLAEEFNKLSLSTRGMEVSSLYEISAIAGQLGIKGKKNILEFTTEIKKLSVTSDLSATSAGESFAQLSNALNEPIKNIRKLSSTFTALASSTTASEATLVNYVQRLAGAGKNVGLTTAEIAGLGATLKDIGATAELSTTAMSALLTKFLTNSEKITSTLGIDFEEFSALVRDKPNKALNLFLTTLGKLDKQSKVKALKEMKLAGAGLSSTLLKLSANTKKLVANQNIATEAYKKGTATEEEFAIASQSLKAKQEQLTSSYKLMAYQLGSVLEPALIGIIDQLVPMAKYVGDNSENFIKLAKFVGTLTIAWKGLNLVMSLSPLGRMIALLGTVATVAYKAIKAVRSLYKARQDTAKQTEEYIQKINSKKYKQEQVEKQLGRLKTKEENYTKAIKLSTKSLQSQTYTPSQQRVIENNIANQKRLLRVLQSQTREIQKQVNSFKKSSSISKKSATVNKTQKTTKRTQLSKQQKVSKSVVSKTTKRTTKKTQRAVKKTRKSGSVKHSESYLVSHFEDAYQRSVLKEFEYRKVKLLEEKKNYAKHIKDKVKLNKWYQSELKKILKDETKQQQRELEEQEYQRQRALEKRIEQLRIEAKERLRVIIESQKEQLEAFKKARDKQKAYEEANQKALANLWAVGLGEVFNSDSKIFENLSTDITKVISDGVSNGFENVDYSSLASSGAGAFSSLANSFLDKRGLSEQQTQARKWGSALGAVAGAYFGGALGASLGSSVGGLLGGLLGGGKKTDLVEIFAGGDIEIERRTSGSLLSFSSYKRLDEDTIKAQYQIDRIKETYTSLLNTLGVQENYVVQQVERIVKEDLGEHLIDGFFSQWVNLNTQNSQELELLEAKRDALYGSWKAVAESTETDLNELLIRLVGGIKAKVGEVFLFNNRDDLAKTTEYKINQLKEEEEALEKVINAGDVNLSNYDTLYQSISRQGDLTPQVAQSYERLGTVLIEQERIADELLKKEKELALTRAKELKDTALALISNNKQLELSSRTYLVNYREKLKESTKATEEATEAESNRITAIKNARDSLNDTIDTIRGFDGDNPNKQDNLIQSNRALNAIEALRGKSTTAEDLTKITGDLNTAITGLREDVELGKVSGIQLENYVKKAREALKDIAIKPKDEPKTKEQIDNKTLQIDILAQVNKAIGDDRTVQSVTDKQLLNVLSSTDLNYVQTSQLIKAFEDKILTADEILNIDGLTNKQTESISEATNITIDRFRAINTQIDHLQSIKTSTAEQTGILKRLDYLFTLSATDIRMQNDLLEDIVDNTKD